MPPCTTLCRLRLHPASLEQQQVLLQARLLHTLLPLQQPPAAAPPPAAAAADTAEASAAAGDSSDTTTTTTTTHQHQTDDSYNLCTQASVQGLDQAVQLEVLRRVQGFVSGLAQARVEQQQQVLPQLQQQLQQLAEGMGTAGCQNEHDNRTNPSCQRIASSSSSSATAVKLQEVSTRCSHIDSNSTSTSTACANGGGGTRTACSLCSSSTSSASAADSATSASEEHTKQQQQQLHPTSHQQLTVPSLGELLGFGNLQHLLLMEQHHLQQQQQQGAADPQPQQQQHTSSITAQLDAMQPGDILLLTSPKWTGLEQYIQQQQQQQQQLQPDQLLAFWDACVDAELVRQQHSPWEDHSASTCSSSKGAAAAAEHLASQLHCQQPPGGWAAPPGSSSSGSSSNKGAVAVQLHCQQPPGGWGVPPGSSNALLAAAADAWEQQQLRLLLQQHAGMAHQKAAGYVQVCVELQDMLLKLEELSAAAAGRAPQLPRLKVIRKVFVTDDVTHLAGPSNAASSRNASSRSSGANSSSASSSSSDEPLACLSFDSIPAVAATCSADDFVDEGLVAQHYGPLAGNGLATLLVRIALSCLPGQQPTPAAAGYKASSSSSSNEVLHAVRDPAGGSSGLDVGLQEQLLSRFAVLRQLRGALKRTLVLGEQMQNASQQNTEQQQQ
jgi:hypothetical protein